MPATRPWHRTLRFRLPAIALLAVLLAFALAAVWSKRYWGYVFAPRAMDERIARIDRVTAYADAAIDDKGVLV
jgi:hypothetical protein